MVSTSAPVREYLAIADISGYTSYLAGVELDHAHDILSDLTVTIVEAMTPFGLAKLEGDAAFMTAPDEAFDGSSLQDTIEGTYSAFQRRLRDIKQASTCECNACVRIPDLDLKVVIHHGSSMRQQLMGLVELVGPDVILVHRLLKNSVRELTGIMAYALYTESAVAAAGIDAAAQGLLEHPEETDVAGTVVTWLRDLHAVWLQLGDRPRPSIPLERRAHTFEFELDVPIQLAFEYLTAPALRVSWDAMLDDIDEDSAANHGRRGTGTTNHCVHGTDAFFERILDWRPSEFWLTETTLPMPGAPPVVKSEELTARLGGTTHVQLITGSVDGRTPEDDADLFAYVGANMQGRIDAVMARVQVAQAELARRAEGATPLPEPGMRHLTEPATD